MPAIQLTPAPARIPDEQLVTAQQAAAEWHIPLGTIRVWTTRRRLRPWTTRAGEPLYWAVHIAQLAQRREQELGRRAAA